MREIKFRAWDNVKFKMYYVGESEDVSFSFDSNGITAADLTEHDWVFKKLEHLQYSQYTGLHDKNGKEIYEGDIIKHRYEDEPQVVEWSERICCYKINSTEVSERYLIKVDEEGGLMEVIGNQFENPELLEGERRNG